MPTVVIYPSPRQRPHRRRVDEERDLGWKDKPQISRLCAVDGEDTRLYFMGAVAKALGKKPGTLRVWLRAGVLPEPSIRTVPVGEEMLSGDRRFWTEEQVEALARIGTEEGVTARRPEAKVLENFSARAHELWRSMGW